MSNTANGPPATRIDTLEAREQIAVKGISS
jgi:hypothetical protein